MTVAFKHIKGDVYVLNASRGGQQFTVFLIEERGAYIGYIGLASEAAELRGIKNGQHRCSVKRFHEER